MKFFMNMYHGPTKSVQGSASGSRTEFSNFSLLQDTAKSLSTLLQKKSRTDLPEIIFQGRLYLAQLRDDYILVVIRISVCIQDRIEGFFTIARGQN